MKLQEMIRNLKTSLAVATGIVAIFGGVFIATTFVVSAAEEAQTPAPTATPETDVSVAPPPAAPTPAPEPSRRRGPAFTDMDADGNGSISQEEFDAFRPAGPPPRFEDDAFDGPPRAPRADRYDDRAYRQGPPERRYDDGAYSPRAERGPRDGGPRGDGFGPPPPPPGGRYDDRFDRAEHRGGGDCPHSGPQGRGPQGGGPRGDGFGPGEHPRPPRRPDF